MFSMRKLIKLPKKRREVLQLIQQPYNTKQTKGIMVRM
jgi:hypothetical protein